MKLLDINVALDSRSDYFNVYPLGDLHIGAFNCADKHIRAHVARIAADDRGLWFGGGDIFDAVIFQDTKRFDPNNLPDWMLRGPSSSIRNKVKDIVKAQLDYGFKLLNPIKNKCIGMLQGNHEYTISSRHNRDIMSEICKEFHSVDLTDHAFIRFKCTRGGGRGHCSVVRAYVCHGYGSGRSPGSEPTHLTRLAQERDCEFILRGHSHTFHIMPPIPRLTIPKSGDLPETADTHDVRVANWGSWLLSYAIGPSTYDSRANYPVRALSTLFVRVYPFKERGNHSKPEIGITEVVL